MIRVKFAIILFVAMLCLPRGAFAFTASVSDYLYEYGVDRYKAGDIADAIHELKKALIADPGNEKAQKFLRKISFLITDLNSCPKAVCLFEDAKFSLKTNPLYNPDNLTYVWNFGDGVLAQGRNVAHRYSRPGEYVVVVKVQGNPGLECLVSESLFKVKVHERPKAVIKIREKIN